MVRIDESVNDGKRCRSCGGRLLLEEERIDPISGKCFVVWCCISCGVRQTENEFRKGLVRGILGLRAKPISQRPLND